MKSLSKLLVMLCLIPSINLMAQSTVLDGLYVKEHSPARRVIPYAHLREGDVMWLKRIWRTIDLREKINHPLYYPTTKINDRQSMFDVIKDAMINDGTITAFSTGPIGADDEFTEPLTIDEIKKILFSTDTNQVENQFGEFEQVITQTEVLSSEIKQYGIKEEWFFDKQRSVMDVRIIGIAPMREEMNEFGEFKGYKKLFWIYYPEARYVFKNAPVFNRQNDSERRTIEDIIWKRQFGSFITKETNVYDRAIMQYKTGLDALLEAEQIKEKLFLMEHDLWHF